MLFHTPAFLVFFILLLATLGVVRQDTPRKLVLLTASYIFYMWWSPIFVILLLITTALDYGTGRLLEGEERAARRKLIITATIVANLSLLGFFKYAGFLSETLLHLMQWSGFEANWTPIQVLLPVGISFYTFQSMGYSIDVYRRAIPATRSVLDFAFFVTYFPHLVAGPILRASTFLPQLKEKIRLGCDRETVFLILGGLIKKVVVADNLAVFVDAVFADPGYWPSVVIWMATLMFAVQIYCDFSGYTDIAIGIARILGFRLPENFRFPYVARNPSDFWLRWHISLSSWLRDYLYIPLGGNRGGSVRTYENLMVTMILGGLWHGASWNFVLWGFLHGLMLIVHRLYTEVRLWQNPHYVPSEHLLVRILSVAAMQYMVLLTWITFRVTDFDKMLIVLEKFLFLDGNFDILGMGLGNLVPFTMLFLLGAFLLIHGFSALVGGLERWLAKAPMPVAAGVSVGVGIIGFCLWPLSEQPFIYFQF